MTDQTFLMTTQTRWQWVRIGQDLVGEVAFDRFGTSVTIGGLRYQNCHRSSTKVSIQSLKTVVAATVKSIRLMLWFGQAERAALIIYWFIGSKKFRQPAADDDIQLLEDYPAVHLTSL